VDQYRERSVERPDVNAQNPDVQVQVFVHEGQGTVNMDTSVLPLHMRGYRRESVEAPMRETLAAHMLHMAGIPQHFRFFNEVRQSTAGLSRVKLPKRRFVVVCTTRHDTTRHDTTQAEAKESLVLSDPMCGSGTILAEAALMATQTPAAFLREKW
jgi:23S rRNA G2445 N2-methylase RlmL